jgi:RNA polymerase sigma-70 factor (ECF subfamily)
MSTLVSSRPAVADGRRDFDDFFEAFARQVAAIVAVSTGDAALAEDATQEAMARAYVRWNRVSKLDRPDLWVIRVAANIAIDSWRRRRREVDLSDSSASAEPPDEIRVLWLRWAMERLTPEDRLLLILRHRDGLSIDEISASLAKSPNTITTYLKRARRRLRSFLSEGDL